MAAISETRVVLAEPHDLMREAIARVLASHAGVRLVAAVHDLAQAGQAARQHRADVLVADEFLLAGARAELGPLPASTKVVALGMDPRQGEQHARRLGASAYVPKDQAHVLLPDVLRDAQA